MTSARLSPTANLLRKSRVFALPQALRPPQDPPTSRAVHESETATLPHPIRASIVTPRSSLAKGDWGLKRPLPAKSTLERSGRPVVRVNALDTFEHVTDFDSAADHTVTLEKFQELHMPMSLPSRVNYSSSLLPNHESPFESTVDNSDTSKSVGELGVKQYRHSGPWLAGQTEGKFQSYLGKVQRDKPELLKKLREIIVTKRTAERRKAAQDAGGDLEVEPVHLSEEEFQHALKALRADPAALGPMVFELLDLPSPPAVPSAKIGTKYFQSPGTKLSSSEYAISGPPRTHPSAGLSYSRSHALLYNHPQYGPQANQRPVPARILRPKANFKGSRGRSRAIAGVGGIAVEDINTSVTWNDMTAPGMAYFDASVSGGAKTWVTPIRASVDSDGRISLASFPANPTARAPYSNMNEPKTPTPRRLSDLHRDVPKLDHKSPRYRNPYELTNIMGPAQSREDVTRNLLQTLGS